MKKWTEQHHQIASGVDALLCAAERALKERDTAEIVTSMNDMIFIVNGWEKVRGALNPHDRYALTRRIARTWKRLNDALRPID